VVTVIVPQDQETEGDAAERAENANVFSSSPLHNAFKFNHEDICQYLYSLNTPLSGLDTLGYSPLHYATLQRNIPCALWLINVVGVNPLQLTDCGRTCLHLAARSGSLETVESFLGCGMDVNCKSSKLTTPLFDACVIGSQAMVNLLVAEGADIYAVDAANRTPFHCACMSGNLSLVKALSGSDGDSPVPVRVDEPDIYGMTPLLLACERGHGDVSIWLLNELGCCVYQKGGIDDNMNTALHMAASNGHLQMVQWLVSCGLKVETLNGNRNTAKEEAHFVGHEAIAIWLEDVGDSFFSAQGRAIECLEPQLMWALNCNHFRFAKFVLDEIMDY
jgi:ankyrin repeat protein